MIKNILTKITDLLLKPNLKQQRGSTIIELLIAVMIVGLIITAIANAVTYSIKNTGESRFRQVATTLGQEVFEFTRSEKNRMGILNLKNTLTPDSYCFNTLPSDFDTTPTPGACGDLETFEVAGAAFKRDVIVTVGGTGVRTPTNNDPYYINLEVTVSWMDGTESRDIQLIQEFEQSSGFTN
jgi:type II secretory pathway pseudopilin PulG